MGVFTGLVKRSDKLAFYGVKGESEKFEGILTAIYRCGL